MMPASGVWNFLQWVHYLALVLWALALVLNDWRERISAVASLAACTDAQRASQLQQDLRELAAAAKQPVAQAAVLLQRGAHDLRQRVSVLQDPVIELSAL